MTDRKPRPRPVPQKPTTKGSVSNENGSKTPCEFSSRCGGCTQVHIPYGEQLKRKQSAVEKLLSGICKVEPILGMSDPWHYRSKVHAVIGTDFKTKQPVSGVYQRGTHRVVPVQGCLIEDPRADRIIQTIVGMIPRYKLRIYNENTHRGFLRHVMVRTGHHTGQIMVILVATASEFPGGKAFVAELTEKHPEITTVVLNVNQKETSMVLGSRDYALFGPGYMEDELLGKRFRISPQSFYQVNARQTEVLYQTAIDLANLTGKETLLDAYCGTGTIGLCASDRVQRLIGVELNADAVRDAKVNAKLNRVTNADFICEDAGRFMVRLAKEGRTPDVLIMDPPRSGSDERFLRSVLTSGPKTIVYVSCNPETLARDARFLVKGHYTAVKAVPVDMFPHTEHCECVMLLQRDAAPGSQSS
ncbi:MAG: 23S rRNA (uracil(1939)-C(5))-methyltransferase RlmD [Clostridiales bacterium]|nr:23S rRNA (uracil(1939)-C(5))-methyltransferase RlmD [Clostridiales bacterium]